MTLKQRIKDVQAEIENFEWQPNVIPFFPLPDKFEELIFLFTTDKTGNPTFIEEVNSRSIERIKWCIKECKNGYGKDEWWINFTINRQIKEWVKSAVNYFYIACKEHNVNILNKEIL